MNIIDKNIELEFEKWMTGIQEDDPLPYEIKYVYFLINFSNADIEISFSASENNVKIYDYADYYPLEAQYFFCNRLQQIASEKLTTKEQTKMVFDQLKVMILNASKKLEFLKNKKIIVAQRFEKQVK